MNPKLDRKGVVVNPQDLIHRKLFQLRFRPKTCNPTIKNPLIKQIPNPPHCSLPLLLHCLIIIRHHNTHPRGHPPEQMALLHNPEHPIPDLHMVSIENTPEFLRIERCRLLRDLGRGVMEARHGCKLRGWWGGDRGRQSEVPQEDGAPARDLLGWVHWFEDRGFWARKKKVNQWWEAKQLRKERKRVGFLGLLEWRGMKRIRRLFIFIIYLSIYLLS